MEIRGKKFTQLLLVIHYENSYPQYRLHTCSYSFSNAYKTITYSFKCVWYVSPNLISTGYYTYSGSNTLS